jgi:hypothetical protein
LKYHKVAFINIYTETRENAPIVKYIGDIIRLRRFSFRIGKDGDFVGSEYKYSN